MIYSNPDINTNFLIFKRMEDDELSLFSELDLQEVSEVAPLALGAAAAAGFGLLAFTEVRQSRLIRTCVQTTKRLLRIT